MKRTTLSIVVLASLVVVLLIVTAFATVSSVSAQLGNTSVPVHCWGSVGTSSLGYLQCLAADGTAFENSENVPAGHYLMVTDVLIEPQTAETGSWTFWLYRLNGLIGQENVTFHSSAFHSEHFSAPTLVLRPNERLGVYLWGSSTGVLQVEAFGLLTTNASYLPMITK